MSKVFCTNCGASIRVRARFCTACGREISKSNNERVGSASKERKLTSASVPRKGKSNAVKTNADTRTKNKPETTPDVDRSGKVIFLAIIATPVILLLIANLSSGTNLPYSQPQNNLPVQAPSDYEPDYSIYSKKELCERFPEQAKKLGKKCKDSKTETSTPQSPSPSASKADPSFETGYALMMRALGWLNDEDPNGRWFQDPYKSTSDLVVGVLLDDYSVYPSGCAAWWFNSKSDKDKALDQGRLNLFSENYWSWVYDSGPALLVVTNSESDRCYKNIRKILELQD